MAANRINLMDLDQISAQRIHLVSHKVSEFEVAMNKLADSLQARLIDELQNLSPAAAVRAQSLVNLQSALQQQLNKADFDGTIKDFIGNYDAAQQLALETLAAMKIDPPKLAQLDAKALGHLKAVDFQYLQGIGQATIQSIANGTVQNALMGTPRSQIVKNIGATLDTNLRYRAVTYADTALVSYDRRATMAEWQAAGLDTFSYHGPKDIKNREVCHLWVGQIFTLEQIKALDAVAAKYSNKPLLPVLVYGGGWNCRHVFSPVPGKNQTEIPSAKTIVEMDAARAKALTAFTTDSQASIEAIAAGAVRDPHLSDLSRLVGEHSSKVATDAAHAKQIADELAAHAGAQIQAAQASLLAQQKVELQQALHAFTEDAAAKAVSLHQAAQAEKIATAENPNQLITKSVDPLTGKVTYTVAGHPTIYQSSGAAHKQAKKILDEHNPEAAAVAKQKTASAIAEKQAAEAAAAAAKALAEKQAAELEAKKKAELHQALAAFSDDAAKKAVELGKAAQSATIAEASNPNQLINKQVDALTGKTTYTVAGHPTIYSSSGAAHKQAKKVFEAQHPEALIDVKRPQSVDAKVADKSPKLLHLDERNAGAIADVPAAGWQGKAVSIDKGQIEDNNVLVTAETLPDGSMRTVLRMKIRAEEQDAIIAATGQKEAIAKAAPVKTSSTPTPSDFDILPMPDQVVSKQLFKKLLNGTHSGPYQNGYGVALKPEEVQLINQQVADYKVALTAKKAEMAAAQKKPVTVETKKEEAPLLGFKADVSALTTDNRKLTAGKISVTDLDVPIADVYRVNPAGLRQINAQWDDGARIRFAVNSKTTTEMFAYQGTLEMMVPGAPTAELVDGALEKLGHAGVHVGSTTAADRELVYLQKAAYIAKVHKTADWQKLVALPDENLRLRKMQEYWSKRLAVQDVTKLQHYNPDGEYSSLWSDPAGQAGYRIFNRFDLDGLEMSMKDYRLFHSPSYGGGTLEKFLEAALPNNRALVSTMEKARMGVMRKGDGSLNAGGASASSDLGTGGASYAFTRIRKSTESDGIYFKNTALRRMDAISYNGDKFGRTTGSTVEERASTPADFQAYSKNSSNETIFKGYLSLVDELDFIKTKSKAERDHVVKLFKTNGISKLADGRTIEEVIK